MRDAGAIGPDHVAGDVERARRLDDAVADVHGPSPALRSQRSTSMRMVEPEPHDAGVRRRGVNSAPRMVRLGSPSSAVRSIVGFGVEHDPQRIGAMKHGRALSVSRTETTISGLAPSCDSSTATVRRACFDAAAHFPATRISRVRSEGSAPSACMGATMAAGRAAAAAEADCKRLASALSASSAVMARPVPPGPHSPALLA